MTTVEDEQLVPPGAREGASWVGWCTLWAGCGDTASMSSGVRCPQQGSEKETLAHTAYLLEMFGTFKN